MPVLLAILFLIFVVRLGKNAAGQPFVKNPLMPQLAMGYVAKMLRFGVLMMAVAGVMMWVALRPVIDDPTSVDIGGLGGRIIWPWEINDPPPPDGWNVNPDAPPPDQSCCTAPPLPPELLPVLAAIDSPPPAPDATEGNREATETKPDECADWYCPTPGTRWAD